MEKHPKKKCVPKAIRMKLWKQEFGDTLSGMCFVCSREIQVDDFQAGHIDAESNGGKTTLGNLKPICKPCNTSCGKLNLIDFKNSMTADVVINEVSVIPHVKNGSFPQHINAYEEIPQISVIKNICSIGSFAGGGKCRF